MNAAIAQVVRNVPGVLSPEFARMLQEIQLGVPRSDAFRHLAERTDVDELNAFALAMVQADVFGVSIASVLRTQAAQLRIKRRQAIEAKAPQTPVKIVFPLILCILPALFVVIVGPGAIQILTKLQQPVVDSEGCEPRCYAARDEGCLPGRTRRVQRGGRALGSSPTPSRCRATRCGSCSRG